MRREMLLWPVLFVVALLAPLGCGGPADPPATAEAPAPVANDDPCALVPLTTWESALGTTGLQTSRDGARTCDVLDDANGRVAGSVSIVSPSIFDGTPDVVSAEDVAGLGDRAYWAPPGTIYVRQSDFIFSILVNPLAAENNREIATELATGVLERR